MNSTTLVAAVALGLGLLLAAGGSVVLAHARAAVRADDPARRSITQYPAALSALMGFLLTSVSGAVLCWRLVPERGATAVLASIVAGVVLFAVVGAGFARVADRVEERRLRSVPEEVHSPISAPPLRPALTAARSGARALPAGKPAEPRTLPRPRPPAEVAPFGDFTPLVPVSPRPAPVQTHHDATRPPTAPPVDDDAPEPTEAGPIVEAAPVIGPAWGDLDAGWMYHDEADSWFLAVGIPHSGSALLGLPSFALVDPAGPDAPVGTLSRAGAAELTVLPEEPDTPLTDENGVNPVESVAPRNDSSDENERE